MLADTLVGREWRLAYNAYLVSPEWDAKRKLVLARAHGKCEGCGYVAATTVHHLTYANCFDEFLFELVGLCDRCHSRAHPKEYTEPRCNACRYQGSRYEIDWCAQYEVPAKAALSDGGRCGLKAGAHDPLH